MFNEGTPLMEMLKAGAKGYLIKNADKDEVITAIKVVNAGHKYY
jgi:DNA-binding NarL/FixJ family response regulator